MKAHKTTYQLSSSFAIKTTTYYEAYGTRDMVRLYRADDNTFLALAPVDIRNLIYDNRNTGIRIDRDIYPNNP